MLSSALAIEAAGPEHAGALSELFAAAGSGCFCRFWHFHGTSHEWLDRSANRAAENRAEWEEASRSRAEEARGVVAMEDGIAVGWLKVAAAGVMTKAYERRFYRRLPCFSGDREGVFLLACFLVRPSHRRRGVARELVRRAVALAPAWGARALEALPRRPREAVTDDELWTGPVQALLANGFEEVESFEPYPVLRRLIG